MPTIKPSGFYSKSRSTYRDGKTTDNVTVTFIPDAEQSECSDLEVESEDEVPLAQLQNKLNNDVMDFEIVHNSDVESEYTESESESEYVGSDDNEPDAEITDSEEEEGTTKCSASKTDTTLKKGDEPTEENYRWRKKSPHATNYDFTGDEFDAPPLTDWSPRQYFDQFFDSGLFQLLAEQTNLYSVQSKGVSVSTNAKEMEQFIGILITMGFLKYPQYRMYWAKHTKCATISDSMGLKRFETLKRFFHVNDNTKMPKRGEENFDVLYKVRPMIDSLVTKCRNLQQEECHSIDEQIIPTKSRSPIRQYLPKKPHKWGIKVWARCGVSGIVYDFTVYLGKEPNTVISRKYGKVGAVVLQLVKHLPKNVNHKVYMDNLFTSISLFKELKQKGIWAVGTIRSNRLHGADKTMKSKKELTKEGRGSMDYRVDLNSNVTVIRWLDNGLVQAASSFVGPSMGIDIDRWSSQDKKVIKVPCPELIHQYNKHMGGVDLCDMLMALYRVKLGTKKWYMHIVYYCINVSIVNAWILYKRHCNQDGKNRKNIMQLLEFQSRIANSLLWEMKTRLGRPSSESPVPPRKRKSTSTLPADEIRHDDVGHFPIFDDKQQRCKHCKTGYTRIFCEKCITYLCMVKDRNCFYNFHR